MALRNSIFAVSGNASFLDARRDMSGLFVCDKTTMLPIAGILDRSQDNLVTGNSNSMGVTVHPFNAVLNRYGALLIQNDGDVKVPLNAAPSANSRIDVVYVKQHERRPPMSDDSDFPVFGVMQGVAAATPVAPSVPDGALALAQVLLPAGVSNTAAAGVVITQTYIGAAMKGDMLRVQTSAQRDALTEVPDGTLLHNVADNCDYIRKDDKWKFEGFFTESNLLNKNTAGWDVAQIRGAVHNGIANGFFWVNRAGDWRNAKAWDSSHVLDFPDSLKAKGIDLNTATSNKDVVLQIINNSINIRPTVNRDFVKGEWVSGSFSYQLA
jgi:hypothetical protein